MNPISPTVALELPAALFAELAQVAEEQQSDPVQVIATWVRTVRQRQSWQKGWAELRRQVQEEPSQRILLTGDREKDTEAVVEQMRQTREELFDAEYAHLYR